MILTIENHSFQYEMENICRIFYPLEKIVVLNNNDSEDFDNIIIKTIRYKQSKGYKLVASISISGKVERAERFLFKAEEDKNFENECELLLAQALYEVMVSATGYVSPWGILTGVRPTKLMRKQLLSLGEEKAKEYFANNLLVSKEKTNLALSVVEKQKNIIDLSQKNSFSLYISIPFCPTRCSYCSFVSHSIASFIKNIPQYVDLLCFEIEATAKITKQLGLKLESVYFGGGTPTSLDACDLKRLTEALAKHFPVENAREYTVEAGRPDTVDKEKLSILKQAGVSRISINPQSFNDAVLNKIGRNHTAQQTIEAFFLAREQGFDNINMDLIACLPSDTLKGYKKSIERVVALSPENITLHSLALKRSSDLVAFKLDFFATNPLQLNENPEDLLIENGYYPYYMYRQSKSVGNRENVGWCKEGFECIYNIFMMEEIHTVIALGAGGVTKLKAPHSEYIERVFNYKYPYEYISRFDEMIKRKRKIEFFYNKYMFI